MKRLIKSSQEILAMAEDRRHILDTAYSYSKKIAEHIMKCMIYPEHIDYDGWVSEIAKWIEDVSSMNPKRGFKLKPRDYKDNLFVGIGDELQDAKRAVMRFHQKFVIDEANPYPDFEITYEVYSRVFDAYWELADFISNKMKAYSQMDESRMSAIQSDVKQILRKYT